MPDSPARPENVVLYVVLDVPELPASAAPASAAPPSSATNHALHGTGGELAFPGIA